MRTGIMLIVLAMIATSVHAADYHVATTGSDTNAGTPSSPFRTIMAATEKAEPGDRIIVHEGVYRERINPPRGGISDEKRIVYQAAPGEEVIIKGSEPVSDWEHVQHDTWKIRIPNDFFGSFNPYTDEIHGDWFDDAGRKHHTGAVYLDGHWLTEAATFEEVLEPVGEFPYWWGGLPWQEVVLSLNWLKPRRNGEAIEPIPAVHQSGFHGVYNAPTSEGGECIGGIEDGDWLRYEGVDFGQKTEEITIQASSSSDGCIVEFRLDEIDGELLGTAWVPNTGGWQNWENVTTEIRPISGVQTIYLVFRNPRLKMPESGFSPAELGLWFAKVDESATTIWAQFQETNPNEADVEINVRQSVFYPEQPGIDYLTVRGFTMMHAATPWAPPTAEQIGLIGTHWSKGWIIEDNDIRYSTCVGLTLGKYGDEWDNRSGQSVEGYVNAIKRALDDGWSKDNVGHHIVRNNRIAHCEQAGIVGSLGPVFSQITGNVIHDIHVRRLFGGAEMAGIKFHGPIDTLISNNHIYRTARGIWLDWMTQGTRVTGNLLHDNYPLEDLMLEVNHGPCVVDNNIFLSNQSISECSQGGLFAHNLITGRMVFWADLEREIPFHKPHSTEIAGFRNVEGGDTRFYNNLLVGRISLAPYDEANLPVSMAGNVFLDGAEPSIHEADPIVLPEVDPEIAFVREGGAVQLKMTLDPEIFTGERSLITTEGLGKAMIPNLPFMDFDGTPLVLDRDYFGALRNPDNPVVGPFERHEEGAITLDLR